MKRIWKNSGEGQREGGAQKIQVKGNVKGEHIVDLVYAVARSVQLLSNQEDEKGLVLVQDHVAKLMAVAAEQEMIARVQEMQAQVVEAEAEVPRAMAEAFRAGHMGIMDYYRMKNIVSDTRMRDSIAGDEKPDTDDKTES